MFNKNGFITLGKDIFVYKNFVTEQECEILVQEAISVPEDKWRQNFNKKGEGNERSMIWTEKLISIHERIKFILEEEGRYEQVYSELKVMQKLLDHPFVIIL